MELRELRANLSLATIMVVGSALVAWGNFNNVWFLAASSVALGICAARFPVFTARPRQ